MDTFGESKVSSEDHYVRQRIVTLRLLDLELQDFDKELTKPLNNLIWEVNTSFKMREIEFEARRLLNSPEAFPSRCYRHPVVLNLAKPYCQVLSELHQEAPRPTLLQPRDVLLEVAPKVVQGLWRPTPRNCFKMPSKRLTRIAVGLTMAVEKRMSRSLSTTVQQVELSRSVRDNMVLFILGRIKQMFPQNILGSKLKTFAADLLKAIVDATSKAICELFDPETEAPKDCNQTEQESRPVESHKELASSPLVLQDKMKHQEQSVPALLDEPQIIADKALKKKRSGLFRFFERLRKAFSCIAPADAD